MIITSTNDNENLNDIDIDENLSRSYYQKKLRAQKKSFVKNSREDPININQRYSKKNNKDSQKEEHKSQDITEKKRQRLGRRLNWTIFCLILGIISIYLILFFVEF